MMKGLFAWIGFNQATLDYDREPRAAGKQQVALLEAVELRARGHHGLLGRAAQGRDLRGFATAFSAFAFAAFMLVKTLDSAIPRGASRR